MSDSAVGSPDGRHTRGWDFEKGSRQRAASCRQPAAGSRQQAAGSRQPQQAAGSNKQAAASSRQQQQKQKHNSKIWKRLAARAELASKHSFPMSFSTDPILMVRTAYVDPVLG